MKVYGISNCNTVKKAIDWLKGSEHEFEFHDYKKKGIAAEKLKQWIRVLGWEKLVNKKGTTWRSLSEDQQEKVTNKEAAIELMIEKPSLIKRPVIEDGKKLLVGFDEEEYAKHLRKKSAEAKPSK